MRSVASTVLRGLRASSLGTWNSPSGMAVRAYSTQEPITATLFPGDGKGRAGSIAAACCLAAAPVGGSKG